MTTKPIPVRIPHESLGQIDAVARQLDSNRSQILAFSVQTFAAFFEARKVCAMPPDWQEIFRSLSSPVEASPANPKLAK